MPDGIAAANRIFYGLLDRWEKACSKPISACTIVGHLG